MNNKNNKKNKSGFSLVEVMVAALLLAFIVLGGAAVLYRTGGGIQRQQSKREALVAAEGIMEALWNQSYSDLQSIADRSTTRAIVVNGLTMNATVGVGPESTDADGKDYLELSVDIDHLGANDDIVITTRRYPFGISRAAL